MSQTSPRQRRSASSPIRSRNVSGPKYKLVDMTLQQIEKELSDVYRIRAPGMNRGHLATLLAEHRECSESQLRKGSLPISNTCDMTSPEIMHELFYVYGTYAPGLNHGELVKFLTEHREGLIPPLRFLDASAMTKQEMKDEISIHLKLNRCGLHKVTADFIMTLLNISQQAYVQPDDK